jgi:hypothetical protein
LTTLISLDKKGKFKLLIADLNDDTKITTQDGITITKRQAFLQDPVKFLHLYGIELNDTAKLEINEIKNAINVNNIPTIGVSPPQIQGVLSILRSEKIQSKIENDDNLLIS